MSLYLRGKIYWYEFACNGHRYRGTTKCSDLEQAREVEATARANLPAGKPLAVRPDWKREVRNSIKDVRATYTNARKRAKQKGLDFTLSIDEYLDLVNGCRGMCAVTGIGLLVGRGRSEWRSHPWRMSIDRIDSSKGYTKANCRIVAYAVNVALNQWGDDVLAAIADGYKLMQKPHIKPTQKSPQVA